jgi:hypothetical protein
VSSPAAFFQHLRAETAELLHLDINNLSPAEELRLDLTTTLRIPFDDLLGQQLAGQPVSVEKLLALAEKLEHLLPAPKEMKPPQNDARAKLLALVEGARAAQQFYREEELCENCERLAAENSALKSTINFMKTGNAPLRDPDQPQPEQSAAASPTPPSELLPPLPPPATLAPWHGGPPSQSPWNAQPPQQQPAPPNGPGRHYQEGSSSDFRQFIFPDGMIRRGGGGWPWS